MPIEIQMEFLQRQLHTHVNCSTIYNRQASLNSQDTPNLPMDEENIIFVHKFYSTTKKEILPFTSKWLRLENIMLSKVSQGQKAKNHMFSLLCGL
jgi:hypothetical protein